METMTIEYGVYKTRIPGVHNAYAGIIKVGNGKWKSDGLTPTYDLTEALNGALNEAVSEGKKWHGWQVVITQFPGGVVSSPWYR